MCTTTEAWDPSRRLTQQVIVYVSGKGQSSCKTGVDCTYSYSDVNTPFFKLMMPSAAVPGTQLLLNGLWHLSSTAQITKIKIGSDYLCNIFLDSLNPDDALDANSYQNIYCDVSAKIPAGYYNLTLETRLGTPYNNYHSFATKSDGSGTYQLMVVPQITALSSNEGSTSGQRLVVTGSGFGQDLSKVSVSAGGLACAPTAVSNSQIACTVAAGASSAAAPLTAGSGAQYTQYQLTNDNRWNYVTSLRSKLMTNISYFRDASLQGNGVISIQDGVLGTLEAYMTTQFTAYHVRGYFVAPRTGVYNFRLSGDDNAEFWLNPTAGSTDRTQLVMENYLCSQKNLRNYNYPWQNCDYMIRSANITLQAGSAYYYELYAYNKLYEGHF